MSWILCEQNHTKSYMQYQIPYGSVGIYRCIDQWVCPRGEFFYMVICQIPTISPPNPGVGEWGVSLISALEEGFFDMDMTKSGLS